MPGKVKVKVLAGRNLPVMDRSSDTTDAYVEVRRASSNVRCPCLQRAHFFTGYIHTWDTGWLVSRTTGRGVVDTSVDPLWSAVRHSCWFVSPKCRLPPGCDFSLLFPFTAHL
jgi:hypothetical protein